MLSSAFLTPYREKGDPFASLLARSTYLTKYCRDGETWTDTIRRVVEGNCALDPEVTCGEAEQLFSLFWTGGALPPGRGLWTGGVANIPVDARYNCHYGTLRSTADWEWCANMLMCGGGVGIGLLSIADLPLVDRGGAMLHVLCSKSHPNAGEVMPDSFIANPSDFDWLVVEDSRQGWVSALRKTLDNAFQNRGLVVNVSSVRARGQKIKTFGGVACGPGPLATLLRNVWDIVRSAQGRKLSSLECLDITNHIGVCIKSGNVRRSALIVLGSATDHAFRSAKKDWQAVQTHRHSSNNSIVFESLEEIEAFNFRELVEDNSTYGEPGILNLWRIRQTDAYAEGVNPCGEIPLHDREACCLSEIYPAIIGDKARIGRGLELVTRYTMRQRLQSMSDPKADDVRRINFRIGVGLGGLCDFEWTAMTLDSMYQLVRETTFRYAKDLGVNVPIACTTVKPSGTISLLNGSSPGIHAPFAPFYVRRTRIASNDPLAGALLEAKVACEPCVYDQTGNTLVFSFPVKSLSTKVTVQNQTIAHQINRQAAVQRHWADNSVSATLSFGKEETEQLATLLRHYVPALKSTSCLPKAHGYSQPPYEEITEEDFSRMHGAINHLHPLVHGGELEVDECATGACPVR